MSRIGFAKKSARAPPPESSQSPSQDSSSNSSTSRKRSRRNEPEKLAIDLSMVLDLTVSSDEDDIIMPELVTKSNSMNSGGGGSTSEDSLQMEDEEVVIPLETTVNEGKGRETQFQQFNPEDYVQSFVKPKHIKLEITQINFDKGNFRTHQKFKFESAIQIPVNLRLCETVNESEFHMNLVAAVGETNFKPSPTAIINLIIDPTHFTETVRDSPNAVNMTMMISRAEIPNFDRVDIELVHDDGRWIRNQQNIQMKCTPTLQRDVGMKLYYNCTVSDSLEELQQPIKSMNGPTPSSSQSRSFEVPEVRIPVPMQKKRKSLKIPPLAGGAQPIHLATRTPYRPDELYEFEGYDGMSVSHVEKRCLEIDEQLDALRMSPPLTWLHKVGSRWNLTNPNVDECTRHKACWTFYARDIYSDEDMLQAFYKYLITTQHPPHISELWKLVLKIGDQAKNANANQSSEL